MPLNVDSLNAGTISQEGSPVKPYKVYTALLTQTGTDAPVATVLENTIGDIWFTYNGDGDFWVQTSTLIFNPLKTIIFLGETNDVDNEFKNERPNENGQNEIGLYTFSSGVESNDILQKTSIEIRVYN
jgi:hypothetical protein